MMSIFQHRIRAVVGALAFVVSPSLAQQPTPQQAQALLQNQSGAAIRDRIAASGMTPDQIRARLRAAGYPETLLDSYLPGSTAAPQAAGTDVMTAVRFLGLVDAQQLDSLGRLRAGTSVAPVVPVEKSKIFGIDVFRRSTSQFEPDIAGPVDATYRVGPRDVLAVILSGGVENSYTLEVTREGFVVLPSVGQVYVANLTLDQVTDLLYRRLRTVYSGLGRGPDASTKLFVTVGRLRANQVFVIGDVVNPGSYQISSAGTMLTALYAAGGPTENGNLRNVELRRAGARVGRLDLYSYLASGETAGDARMQTGDVVFVPVHGPRAEIRGAVARPSIYELAPGETLNDLLRFAGGFSAEAARERVLIRRILPPSQRGDNGRDRTVIDVKSDTFVSGAAPAIPLLDGDIVEVFPIAARVRDVIVVTGAVWTPGAQGFRPGMRLSDALAQAGGVHSDVRDVQINRLQPDQSRSELRATFADTLGRLTNDLVLQDNDSITVFSASDFRPDRYVAITGAVRDKGRYPYREGMTLRDLLHYAGGLEDGAYLTQAEIARVPTNRSAGALAVTVTVPLDSTYLFERGLDGKYQGPPGLAVPASGAPEIPLRPYDNVLILQQPDWSLERSVTIRGEVLFPGEYVLRNKAERLSDVIQRAGGLTDNAYPAGAYFTRLAVGRIGFDLARALRDPAFRDNLIMEAGDSLYVPTRRQVVDVRGGVHSPLAVAYSPGKNIDYYINAAGGATFNADHDRAYVQQPNGVVEPYRKRGFFPDSRPDPQPGAIVIVPLKDPNSKRDWVQIAGSVAQVVASIVGIVAIATR